MFQEVSIHLPDLSDGGSGSDIAMVAAEPLVLGHHPSSTAASGGPSLQPSLWSSSSSAASAAPPGQGAQHHPAPPCSFLIHPLQLLPLPPLPLQLL